MPDQEERPNIGLTGLKTRAGYQHRSDDTSDSAHIADCSVAARIGHPSSEGLRVGWG
jgi:hypothetical protein